MMARTIDTLQEKLPVINTTTHRKPVTTSDQGQDDLLFAASKELQVSYNNNIPVDQVVLVEGRSMLWEESVVHVH